MKRVTLESIRRRQKSIRMIKQRGIDAGIFLVVVGILHACISLFFCTLGEVASGPAAHSPDFHPAAGSFNHSQAVFSSIDPGPHPQASRADRDHLIAWGGQ